MTTETSTKRPTLFQSLLPIVILIAMLAANVFFFGEDSSYGSNQIALLVAAAMAAVVGVGIGKKWKEIYRGIVESIGSAMGAIIILLFIGALAGTWLLSGIVPAMIYYGLKVLNPEIFLLASCVICAVVSIATGSSWSTVATVGIALLGIGSALGISEGWVAGSIISGAYFGDKMSPLSDTTNLAPAVAGTDLFTHIRHMVHTTVPSISIAILVYIIVGLQGSGDYDPARVDELTHIVNETFNITPMLFLVPVAVILLIVKRMPAIPALMIGSLLGGFFALVYQPEIVAQIAEDAHGGTLSNYFQQCYIAMMASLMQATTVNLPEGLAASPESQEALVRLLSAGGMSGMMNTIWLIICALTFGGVMQACGFLKRITAGLLTLVSSRGSLILTTSGTCIFFNVTASDQYIAIVVPGKMFADAFRDYDLAPKNLSRTLEDSGTVTSVLIPWNTCGVAQSGVLGVAVLAYAPYAIFNWISPLMTIFFGYMGWKLTPLSSVSEKVEAHAQ
ncbi:MAG: Na+/H+ antiporter NhaC [Flavobacteriales bacterium]|nr:Na+/H+ antiporter NhaC [Flavobacteriales bacterium]